MAGKVAVVTGAARGLGAAMARVLLASGARVAGIDIDGAALGGAGFVGVVADVSQAEQCEAAMARIAAALGPVDILVNNAGLGPSFARPEGFAGALRFWEADAQGWQRTLNTNAAGPFLMARLAARGMIAQGWGRIVNITTSYDTMLAEGFCAYGPSKAALEASTALWAKELAGTGVTANVLIPGGPTDTGHPEFAALRGTNRLLQPDVLAAPLRFLCSDLSAGFTGRRLIARDWSEALPPQEAAAKASAPAAWPDLAERAGTARPGG